MARYEVGVRAYQHITVEADSEEEAQRKAEEKARLSREPVNAYQVVNLDGE